MRKLDPIVKDYLAWTPWRGVVQDQINVLVEALDGNKAAIARRMGKASA